MEWDAKKYQALDKQVLGTMLIIINYAAASRPHQHDNIHSWYLCRYIDIPNYHDKKTEMLAYLYAQDRVFYMYTISWAFRSHSTTFYIVHSHVWYENYPTRVIWKLSHRNTGPLKILLFSRKSPHKIVQNSNILAQQKESPQNYTECSDTNNMTKLNLWAARGYWLHKIVRPYAQDYWRRTR